MPINIIEADIENDIETFVQILNRNRSHHIGRERFEWLYLKNPQGKARAWVVIDEKSNQPVAFTCVLPRMVMAQGQELLCWNCGDFSVDNKFRTLGVATKLRRVAKDCVENGEISAIYAHPNDRMKVIHENVNHTCIGTMQRFVKLLKANQLIKKYTKSDLLSVAFSPFINAYLNVSDSFRSINKQYRFQEIGRSSFNTDYDQLWNNTAKQFPIIGDRRSSYLNWRYHQNPLYTTERIEMRNTENKLLGYIIFYIENNTCILKDIFCSPNEAQIQNLLVYWTAAMRSRGVHSLSAVLFTKNPILPILLKNNFRSRPEISSVFVHIRSDNIHKNVWLDGENWFMTVGDRDI